MAEPMICLVTGANTGLGFETALGLAKAGHHVILACRSADKANAAMGRIAKSVQDVSLEFVQLDLVDRDSIRACAATVKDRHNRLDRLINNAGVMGPPQTITKNGVELQFDANHLGHFLLTRELIPLLEATPGARIINVASLAAKRDHADIHFDNINHEGTYDDAPKFMGLSGMGAYSQSKLANVLFTMGLKDRLAKSGSEVTPLVVHPGVSNTDLSRNMSPLIRLLAPILVRFMDVSTPADGARPSLMAALQGDVQAGDFYGPTGEGELGGPPGAVPLPPQAADQDMVDRLWALSEDLLGTTFEIGTE